MNASAIETADLNEALACSRILYVANQYGVTRSECDTDNRREDKLSQLKRRRSATKVRSFTTGPSPPRTGKTKQGGVLYKTEIYIFFEKPPDTCLAEGGISLPYIEEETRTGANLDLFNIHAQKQRNRLRQCIRHMFS